MTTTEDRPARTPEQNRRIAMAAARASIKLYEYDKIPVPQWIRDAAAGLPVTPPPE